MPGSESSPPSDWRPARVLRLGDPQTDDLTATTTVAERVEMVWVLSRRMWEFTGRPFPTYARSEIPIRVVRPQ